jgi:hypothetical protein
VPDFLQPNSQRQEGLDISAGTVSEEGDFHKQKGRLPCPWIA